MLWSAKSSTCARRSTRPVIGCCSQHRFVDARTAENDIRFSRPDGRVIEENPRLPATGSIEGLMGKREREDCGCDTQRA
jgi:hypothetical protein